MDWFEDDDVSPLQSDLGFVRDGGFRRRRRGRLVVGCGGHVAHHRKDPEVGGAVAVGDAKARAGRDLDLSIIDPLAETDQPF